MDNDLRWDQIRYVAAVARAGSAVAAARRLGVSHATVMRNLAQLEAQLGIRLFDHARSGYRITADGEHVLASAHAMEEHAEALLRKAQGKAPAPAGRLHLAICDTALFDPLPLLQQFREAYPRIELALHEGALNASARDARIHTDAEILVTNEPPEALVGRQIARLRMNWYAAARSGPRRAAPKPDDVDFVLWTQDVSDEASESWQRSELRRLTSRPRVVLQTDRPSDALAAVRAGMGAALLSDAHSAQLRRLPWPDPRESLPVWLLTHPDQRRSGRVRALFDFIADRLHGK